MRIETEQLEYWGEKFTDHNLQRYMTFATFMTDPQGYWDSIMEGDHRPLLIQQQTVRARLNRACLGLEGALERLESQVAHLRRIDNGHPYEPLKHHANGR